MSWFVSYIIISHDMNIAWRNFTNSRVTSREIGTKFLRMIKAIKYLRKDQNPCSCLLDNCINSISSTSEITWQSQVTCIVQIKLNKSSNDSTNKATYDLDNEYDHDLFVSFSLNFWFFEFSSSWVHHYLSLMSRVNNHSNNELCIFKATAT